MSKPGITGLTTILLLVPLALQAQTDPSWTADQRAIVDLIQRTEVANNAGDVEAWVALFADEATAMTSDD